VADPHLLCVPDGYAATSGQVSIALGDVGYNLVCAVAGESMTSPKPVSAGPLTVTMPATSTSTSVGNPSITPAPLPSASLTVTALSTIKGAVGMVPITVMSAAPTFSVVVDLVCTRGLPGGSDPLLTAWQMRVYDRLLQAWQEQSDAYAAQLLRRVEVASAGHTGEVQRSTLKQDCLGVLMATVSQGAPSDVSLLEPLFNWADMTWHCEPWPASSLNPWPQPVTSMAACPSSERLFQRFLQAPSARVLLPVSPGWEAWLLCWLQYQQPWAGGPASVPVTAGTIMLLEALRADPPEQADAEASPASPPPLPGWTVRLPTSMLYLQEGPDLPTFLPAPSSLEPS
jgi:hypothetical protein